MSLLIEANAPQRHEKRGPQAPSRSIRALDLAFAHGNGVVRATHDQLKRVEQVVMRAEVAHVVPSHDGLVGDDLIQVDDAAEFAAGVHIGGERCDHGLRCALRAGRRK